MIELLIGALKAIVILLLALNLAAILLWFERKGSALIQDRIGANRAAITGLGKKFGLPNLGFVNTVARAVPCAFPGADHFRGSAVRRPDNDCRPH
jgi:hypothetical protein